VAGQEKTWLSEKNFKMKKFVEGLIIVLFIAEASERGWVGQTKGQRDPAVHKFLQGEPLFVMLLCLWPSQSGWVLELNLVVRSLVGVQQELGAVKQQQWGVQMHW
jgi:hypothetical protein